MSLVTAVVVFVVGLVSGLVVRWIAGLAAIVALLLVIFGVSFDGGFAMGADLPLVDEVRQGTRQVTTSSGRKAVVGPKASFGTLSSGGLY